MNQSYLRGLNGIRGLAALAVVTTHIFFNFAAFGLGFHSGTDLGGFGVTIFFSLSGFLITLLLLIEKEKATIHVGRFYMRRILRIWPLYYLYIVVCFFLIGFGNNADQIPAYLFFVPNLPYVKQVPIPVLAHYWSLGIEEQFYLLWPMFLKYCKNILCFLLTFIVCFLGAKLATRLVYGGWSIEYTIFYTMRFDCMAIGGLGAWLFFKKKIPVIIYSVWIQYAAWMILALTAINRFHIFSIIDHDILAVVTLLLILNQSQNSRVILSLDNKVFDYLGRISFGIYIYHPLVIAVLVLGIKNWDPGAGVKIPAIFAASLAGTLIVAHISYFYFERVFLKLKDQFASVKSD